MNDADPELEQLLANPEFSAQAVFSDANYLMEVVHAMLGRFLRAIEEPKEGWNQVQQKHWDQNSACAGIQLPSGRGIFVVWAFDFDKQGPQGKSGLALFRGRAKNPKIRFDGSSSPEIREQVLERGALRIQVQSPAHPASESDQYQICQLKNVGWYVAGLIPPTKPPAPPTQPGGRKTG